MIIFFTISHLKIYFIIKFYLYTYMSVICLYNIQSNNLFLSIQVISQINYTNYIRFSCNTRVMFLFNHKEQTTF